MKCGPKPAPAAMLARMKPLSRRHRLAHLRALIRREPVRSVRREGLTAMMRDEAIPAELRASPEQASLVDKRTMQRSNGKGRADSQPARR